MYYMAFLSYQPINGTPSNAGENNTHYKVNLSCEQAGRSNSSQQVA
jgi:hypothetical protein